MSYLPSRTPWWPGKGCHMSMAAFVHAGVFTGGRHIHYEWFRDTCCGLVNHVLELAGLYVWD